MSFLPNSESSRPSSSDETIITQALQKQAVVLVWGMVILQCSWRGLCSLGSTELILVLLQIADHCFFLPELGE